MTRVNLNDCTPATPLSTEERQHEIIRELVEEREGLRAKLRASEADFARLTAELAGARRNAENTAGIFGLKCSENARLADEVARLTRELEDVRKLDASGHGWHMRDSSPGCEEVCYVPAVRSDGWYAPPGQHAAARRAAVEYLEKERKDG